MSTPATQIVYPSGTWKTIFWKSFGFGVGAVFGLALIVFAVVWYRARPKPWNSHTINASFDGIGVEGDNHTLVFYYIVENRTSYDYSLENKTNVLLTGRLKTEKAIGPQNEYATIAYTRI